MDSCSLQTSFSYRQSRMKLFWFLLLLMLPREGNTTECGRFDLPFLKTRLTLGAVANVRFRLALDKCPENDMQESHYVDVYHPHDPERFCTLKFREGTCKESWENCFCVDGSGVINKTVTMLDGGVWIWKTGDGIAPPLNATFEIQKPTTSENHTTTSTDTPGFHADTSEPSVDDGDDDNTAIPMSTADHEYGSKTYTTEDDVSDVVTQKDPTIDGDGKDAGGTTKKKEHDEEDKDGGLHSSIITGVVVAGANVATIIVVGVVIGVCRRRRRRTRSRSSVCYSRDIKKRVASLPIPPTVIVDDIMLRNRCIDPLPVRSTSDGCQMADRIYEEIPALSGVPNEERISDGYTNPVYQARRT